MGAENESPAAGASGPSSIARRTVLKGFAAAGASVGATAGVVSAAASPAAAAPAAPGAGAGSDDWAAFDRLIGKAFDQMDMVGAAVAVVSADRVLPRDAPGVSQPPAPAAGHR